MIRKTVKGILTQYHKLIDRFGGDGDRVVFDPSSFPWIADLEASWRDIREELDPLLKERDRVPSIIEVDPGQLDFSDTRWRTFFFYVYNLRVDENCNRCPRTAALLEKVPGMTMAMFSILEPHTSIPPHIGYFKGILRYHLGLVIPARDASCGVRVGDQTLRWEEGKSLVFDDTVEHEAWNRTPHVRAILFIDFVRPLPAPLSWINHGLVGLSRFFPVVRATRANARHYAQS